MRYLLSLAAAVLVSLALFYLMHYMISGGRGDLKKVENYSVVDFVRLKRESEPEVRKRTLPKKPPPPKEPPPPPKLKVAQAEDPNPPELKMDMPDIKGFKGGGGPFLGGTTSGAASQDGDIIPLVRIAPQYPRKAAMQGKEGWVKLEFTITESGTVTDVRVLESNPRRIFDRAAVRAILKWKFKPKLVDGKPVTRRAVQVIEFKLNKD
ncbi:MAG TPA: energy transducer TonB [Thiotrichales bacterium]|nr:energy transducer TonB [Thiotrichales bacterium]